MRIIELAARANGGHDNQTIDGAAPDTFPVPEGWAVIPEDLDTPNYPFGEAAAESVEGVMTVTKWTPGVIPEEVV